MSRATRSAFRAAHTASAAVSDTLWVALLALFVRIWHLAEYARLPYFQTPLMDARYHVEWAERLMSGVGDREPFFRAPLYPYLLAAVGSLSGGFTWGPRGAQLAMGVLSVILAHRLATRVLSRPFAAIAGVLAALFWLPIHHETELLLEPTFAFLCLLLLWLTAREPARVRDWLLLGLVFGLGAITRPNLLIFFPALVWYATPNGAKGRGPFLARLTRTLVYCSAGATIAIGPVWFHNARCGDPRTLIASQGGINLYLGNNASANGWSAVAEGMRTDWKGGYEDAIRIANQDAARDRSLKPSEVSDYWARRAWSYWRHEPAAARALLVRKLRMFWTPWEIKNNEDPAFFRATLTSLRVLPVSFAWLTPLALVGLAIAFLRSRLERLLALFVLSYVASIALFFVCSRYRIPIAFLLPIFATVTLETVVRAWRGGTRLRSLGWTAAVFALFPLLRFEPPGITDGGFFQSYSYLGDTLSEQRRWLDAAGAYERALGANPRHVNSWNNRGLAYERLGRWREAEDSYRGGLRVVPTHPLLQMNLALALRGQGRWDEAAGVLDTLATQQPKAPDIAYLHGECLERSGRVIEALETFESVAPGTAPYPHAVLSAVRLRTERGELDRALELLRVALAVAPGHAGLQEAQRALTRGLKQTPSPGGRGSEN